MLHDRTRIHVEAGTGGDGCMSFRREAKVPRGGPDGGDGGRGGEVVLVCDASLRDLHEFRRRVQYHAGRGGHGEGALKHGADGETLTIRVPPGTEARGIGNKESGGSEHAGGSAGADDLQGRRWELWPTASAPRSRAGGAGGAGTSGLPPPLGRRRGSPSADCPARRAGSSCS